MAARHNILIEQGATFLLNLIWKDSEGDPIDLSGYTARMQVRRKVTSPDTLLSLTTENGGITLGGAAGTISVVAQAHQTDDISEKIGVYDLELVTNGTVYRLIEGCVTISPEVTR